MPLDSSIFPSGIPTNADFEEELIGFGGGDGEGNLVNRQTYVSAGWLNLLKRELIAVCQTIGTGSSVRVYEDYGKVSVTNVTNSTYDGTNRAGIDVSYTVDKGIAWLECVDDGSAYGTPCRYAEVRIQTDDDGNIVPYNGDNGAWIQYRRVGGALPLNMSICYEVSYNHLP